jgi:hypothetical protein
VDVSARTVTCRPSGARLSVEASPGASAFGTRPWLVVADEVAQWPDTRNHRKLWAGVNSALAKVKGSRLIVLTSAGSPGHPAHEWLGTAINSPHWRVAVHPGPSPWWSAEEVDAVRESLLPHEYARLIECVWAESADSLASGDDVRACTGTYTVREPVRGTRYVMALDVGTRRDSTVLAIGHMERTPQGRRVVVDRVLRWTGTRADSVSLVEVEEAVVAMWRIYGRPRLVFDFHQAAQLTEQLKRGGCVASSTCSRRQV